MVMMGHEGSRERLEEYFEDLCNVPPPAETFPGGAPRATMAPDPPIRYDLARVISELKEG